MRMKAGIAAAGLAIFALAAFAATGLGARLTTVAQVSRPGAITLRVQAPAAAKPHHNKTPSVVYASTKPQDVPIGTQTFTIGGCPKGTHITNATIAALHGQQAQYLTIHGEGLAVSKGGSVKGMFIDVANSSDTLNPPGFSVKAIGSIVCVK